MGCGVAIDNLRPKNAKVNNSAKTSTGAVSFLHLFDATGSIIGSNNRRAAIMAAINDRHPDLEEFLKVKADGNKLAAMNISIKFTDEFFKAVEENKDWKLEFTVKATGEKITKTINAREFFKEFCQTNYDWGDPGVMYIDKIRSQNLLSGYPEYKIEVSNPCSEFMGAPYTACCLGSINLYNCVKNPFTPVADVDVEKLKNLTRLGVKALNDILDYGREKQPLEANKKAIDEWRNIGLGFFGLADMFVALGIKYGSNESKEMAKRIAEIMMSEALATSAALCRNGGNHYTKFNMKKHNASEFINKFQNGKYLNTQLANGSLISIAPTGSLSLIAGGLCGGIEPYFKVSYERTTHANEDKGVTFRVYPQSIKDLLEYHKLPLNLTNEEIKEKFPFVVEANEINWQDRIVVQSEIQKNIDNAISSTINLPESTTPEEIGKIYMFANKIGLKGITVFRENCKRLALLGTSIPKKESTEAPVSEEKEPTNTNTPKEEENRLETNLRAIEDTSTYLGEVEPMKRGCIETLPAITVKKESACTRLYTTVTSLNGNPFEVFVNVNSGCSANINTIGRLTSLALRCGVNPERIVEELGSQKCPACQTLRKQGRKDIALSCGNAIGEALKQAIKNNKKEPIKEVKTVVEMVKPVEKKSDEEKKKKVKMVVKKTNAAPCPECGVPIHAEGKCVACSNCGWSKCE